MTYIFEAMLNEGRWITADGRIAAFSFDNTHAHLREPPRRDIRWHVLATPTDEEWGLVARPKLLAGRARTFTEAKLKMAEAMGLDRDLFSA